MFDGYLELGGNELVNSTRVASYVRKNAPNIALKDCVDCPDLPVALGDGEYESPKDDAAPWFDPTNPATAKFLGVYPLSIEGVDDSTYSAQVTESIGNGGSVGSGRHATRTMRVHAMLVAQDDLGMEAGYAWLKQATMPSNCNDHGGSCGGANMCFFTACPNICRMWDPEFNAGSTAPYSVDETTSPLISPYPGPGPLWQGVFGNDITSQRDGQIVRWGAVDAFDTQREIESYGPVFIQRTNFIPDSSLTYGGKNWYVPSPISPTGGVDDGAYGTARVGSGGYNFIADPSFEHASSIEELGWTVDGGEQPQIITDLTAPDGDHALEIVRGDTIVEADFPFAGANVYSRVTVPIVGWIDYSTNLFAGAAAAGKGGLALTIFDADGVEVGTNYTDWWSDDPYEWVNVTPLVGLNVPVEEGFLDGWTMRIDWFVEPFHESTPASTLRLDKLVFTTEGTSGFIVGDAPPDESDPDPEWWVNFRWQTPGLEWLGASESYLPSNGVYLSAATFTPTLGDVTMSFALRSSVPGMPANAVVTVRDWDTSADLGSVQFGTTDDWVRYSFTARLGVPVYLEFTAPEDEFTAYDVDQAMAEVGRIALPYMDGDEPWELAAQGFIVGGMETPEYTVSWLGNPDLAGSRIVWNGYMRVGGNFAAPTWGEFWGRGKGVCDAFGFVEVLQGRQSASFSFSMKGEVPIERQLLPYERTMHDVSLTTGVRTIADLPVQHGKMREVEFFLTAGVPFSYSTTETVMDLPFSFLETHLWGEDDCDAESTVAGPTLEPFMDASGPVGVKMTIPTHVSPAGGQTTHPSIWDFGTAWNGYRYWLAHTPYPAGDDEHEDPNIVASNNGTNWVVPAGLTNPIDNATGAAYNSDVNLIYGPDQKLWLFWRNYDPGYPDGTEERIYLSKSSNGVTWSAKVLIHQTSDTVERIVSPSFIFEDNRWTMYGVDMLPSPNRMVRKRSAGPTLTSPADWGVATVCTVTPALPAGRDIWHLEVRYQPEEGEYLMALNDCVLDVSGTAGKLYLARSTNAIDFQRAPNEMLPSSAAGVYDQVYKATFLRTDVNTLEVWYPGWKTGPPQVWDVFRTTVTAPIVEIPPPPVVGIVDPDCVVPPAPPRPPAIPNSCVLTSDVWRRYWLPIPADSISLWSGMSPQIEFTTAANPVRELRARVFRNPFDREVQIGQLENHATNPKLSVDAIGWANLGGVGTATGRQTGVGPEPDITSWYRATASAAHGVGSFGPISAGEGVNLVSAGEHVYPSIWARASIARNLRIRYAFVDEAGSTVGGTILGPSTPVAANTWVRLQPTGISIAPAGTVRMYAGVIDSSAVMAVGQTIDVTGLNLMTSTDQDLAPLGGTYFDGSTLDALGFYYQWLGTPGKSASAATMGLPVDPCDWCAEFVVSYIPPQTVFTVDSILEKAFAEVAGGPAQTVNQLLYGSDGGPMSWPELTCGIPYLLAIDVPPDYVDDVGVAVRLARKV